MADTNYDSRYTGPQIDDAIGRALPGGAIDVDLANNDPSQWGLGQIYVKTVADADEIASFGTGWYMCYQNVPGVNTWLIHQQCAGEKVKQIAWCVNDGLMTSQSLCVRTKYAEYGWQPWEWFNPPMLLGVEYRTTERYLGKPVYVKAVDFGALPNSTRKEVVMGDNSCRIIRAQATTSYGILLTGTSDNEHRATLRIRNNEIAIITDTNQTIYTAIVCVSYYKDVE